MGLNNAKTAQKGQPLGSLRRGFWNIYLVVDSY
jgi:hypothetical protein